MSDDLAARRARRGYTTPDSLLTPAAGEHVLAIARILVQDAVEIGGAEVRGGPDPDGAIVLGHLNAMDSLDAIGMYTVAKVMLEAAEGIIDGNIRKQPKGAAE